ncbi:uncharacterized protein B4U80_12033 [Leptotrombidium deliense]|uniref:C2H2-type domain-containing protein n=1 Tax=Leptotrombidium deliense TaxID=299467 RepID=A0A443RZG1_9ACAR|nr:uncharacterized protein B4U80_12033 [Leptotrombidium deliense]
MLIVESRSTLSNKIQVVMDEEFNPETDPDYDPSNQQKFDQNYEPMDWETSDISIDEPLLNPWGYPAMYGRGAAARNTQSSVDDGVMQTQNTTREFDIQEQLRQIQATDSQSSAQETFPVIEFPNMQTSRGTHSSLKCNDCNQTFRNHASLAEHQRYYHEVGNFICQHCPQQFQYRIQLRDHQEQVHEPQICGVCLRWILGTIKFDAHNEQYHPTPIPTTSYLCDYCGDEYVVRLTYQRHVRDVHRLIWCTICQQNYIGKIEYDRHLKDGHNLG